jgi:hypothetical protein
MIVTVFFIFILLFNLPNRRIRWRPFGGPVLAALLYCHRHEKENRVALFVVRLGMNAGKYGMKTAIKFSHTNAGERYGSDRFYCLSAKQVMDDANHHKRRTWLGQIRNIAFSRVSANANLFRIAACYDHLQLGFVLARSAARSNPFIPSGMVNQYITD